MWPQHLYLNPASPLLTNITLPVGFNISGTPLVTVRRIDILFSHEEMDAIYRASEQGKQSGSRSVFNDRLTVTVPMEEYLGQFIEPLPKASYSTMIIGTGGHWTDFHFNGTIPAGIPGIVDFFKIVARHWVDRFQEVVGKTNQECADAGESCTEPRRRAIIREYMRGSDDCGKAHGADPLTTPNPQPNAKFMNMADMHHFNDVWKVWLDAAYAIHRNANSASRRI